MKYLFMTLLLMSSFCSAEAISETEKQTNAALTGFVYGAGVAFHEQIYKDFHQRSIALPIIGYVGDKLKIFGPYINYSFLKKDHWTLDFVLAPRFNGFSQSDGVFFEGMQERKDTLDAGLNIKFAPKQWRFELKSLHDLLSRSQGSSFDLSVTRKYKIMGLTIEPSVAVNQMNSALTDYYYGVRPSEATQLRPFYRGRSALNKELGLAITAFVPIGIFRLDMDNTWYASGITDSPLVDRSHALSARLAFIRYF